MIGSPSTRPWMFAPRRPPRGDGCWSTYIAARTAAATRTGCSKRTSSGSAESSSVLFLRLYEDEIAQASYLIGCERTHHAIVVDPSRDVARYLRAAEDEGMRITHVVETHIHADFLSGSRDLARRANATLLLSAEGNEEWRYVFAAEATALREGDRFDVGSVRFDVMHTPGHTPEHIALLVTDTTIATEPMGILSGDAVFVGDVGRPDLLVRTRPRSSDDDFAGNDGALDELQ